MSAPDKPSSGRVMKARKTFSVGAVIRGSIPIVASLYRVSADVKASFGTGCQRVTPRYRSVLGTVLDSFVSSGFQRIQRLYLLHFIDNTGPRNLRSESHLPSRVSLWPACL